MVVGRSSVEHIELVSSKLGREVPPPLPLPPPPAPTLESAVSCEVAVEVDWL